MIPMTIKITLCLLMFPLLFTSSPVAAQSTDDNIRITGKVSEFAGLYYVGDVLHINMTKQSTELQEKIITTIQTELPLAIDGDPQIVFHAVPYSFNELQEWYNSLQDRIFAHEFVTLAGIDVKNNYIAIGVESEEDIAILEQTLAATDVPQDAISIEVQAPFIADDIAEKNSFSIWGIVALASAAILGLFMMFVFPRMRKAKK